jgi:hypothetical protein
VRGLCFRDVVAAVAERPVGVPLAVQAVQSDPPMRARCEVDMDEDEMTRAIVEYLAEHPHATDTFEGIVEWWLMRQQIRVSVETLTSVLPRLIESGVLEAIDTSGTRRYRLRS